MRGFLNKVLMIGIKPSMQKQEQKSIFLLNRLSILVIIFFTFISIITYQKLHSPIISYIFILNILVILSTFLVSKYLSITISKYIISIFIPISLIFVGAYAKSIGVTNNMILYLAPRMLMTITLFIPVLLFGYHELKKALFALTPGVLIFILFD